MRVEREKQAKPLGGARLPALERPPPKRSNDTRSLAILIAAVTVIVLAVHWPALRSAALSFDDTQYLTDNALVRNPSWVSAGRFLTEIFEPSTVRGYYQPLAMISLMLDSTAGGDERNLLPFHRTSLVLHALNTAMEIVLLYALFGQVWPAALVGLLFGVHPLTVEPIPWVGERKTLLATFFALGSMVCYVRYTRTSGRGWYFGSLLLFLLALVSKPTVTPLPALLLLLDYWPLRRLSRRAVVEKAPFIILGLAFAVITLVSQKLTTSARPAGEFALSRISLIVCHNVVFYLGKFVWPTDLSSHYPFPNPLSPSQPAVLAGIIGTCTLIALLLSSLRWTRALLTGWLFFFVAIFPTLGIVGFTNVIASDKYAYLPMFGFLMILTWLLGLLWASPSGRTVVVVRRAVAVLLVVAVGGLEAYATRAYLEVWKDTETLHRYMIALAPRAPTPYNNLGYFLVKAQRVDDAVPLLEEAVRLSPNYVDAHLNLGYALAQRERTDDAIEHYRAALRGNPALFKAHIGLARALASKGQREEAARHYFEALRIRPNSIDAHTNLGDFLLDEGRADEALEHFQEAARLDPGSAVAHTSIASALRKLGRDDDALRQLGEALRLDATYTRARKLMAEVLEARGEVDSAMDLLREGLRIDPGNSLARLLLAERLQRRGRTEEAMQECRTVLQKEPQNATAHQKLGELLRTGKQWNEAIAEFSEVVRIGPESASAHANLAYCYVNLDQPDDAIREYREALRIKPDDTETHCNLAILLAQEGRTDEAVLEYQETLRIDPQHARARKGLAHLGHTASQPVPTRRSE